MEQRTPQEIPRHGASGAERLAMLADFVETLPPGKVTFARWYGQRRGCAVGLAAAQDPWFAAQGLKLEREESLKDCRPCYAGRSDWAAVVAFFDVSPADARHLFDRVGYGGEICPAPARVAARIRNHLAQAHAESVKAELA